jgi:type I restriction enzyme S subunit
MKGMVSKSVFESIPLISPPTGLQNKFGLIAKEVELVKKHQKQSVQQIDNLFNVLMQKAFRGELA